MVYTKEKSFARVNTQVASIFVALSGVAMFLPFYIHIQQITGPIINAVLILVLFLVGIRSALVLCMVPSLMALAGGLIPPIMAPVVPFIMLSNMIFILTIDYFYQKMTNNDVAFVTGIALGSLLKFSFLYFSIDLVAGLVVKQELGIKIAQMFGYFQLLTALLGGALAFAILKFLKRI